MTTKRRPQVREIAALSTAGSIYWLTIYPLARREIRHWKHRAELIPDPTLRAAALDKLTREHLNPEAAAFFAILAPARRRAQLVRLIVAFQIAYDYLDAINEPPASASLNNGLQLHRSLSDAVTLGLSSIDYYQHHPQTNDGDYLAELVRRSQTALRTLPSTATIAPVLIQAAEHCGEAQSRNHAALVEGHTQLIDWTALRAGHETYHWWELAAGGISCLALHALFAGAASRTTLDEAERINAAYFPPICAISALLDSLIDYPHDFGSTNHSFVGHYKTPARAAERFATITTEADARLSTLRGRNRHLLLLAGIASFYLSAQEAKTTFALPVTQGTLDSLGPITTPMIAVMRLMRRKLTNQGKRR